ncbi:TetR/AcrR family transcriptional regulator [Nakamurella alba]|nr:TetR/AcrR family transcriptional regulator [Nakamurella alba]
MTGPGAAERKHVRSPRSLEADSKASEMLPAITQILRDRGPEGFALGAIAADLGTSSRMLIYHFGSRDELLGRVMKLLRNDTIALLGAPPPIGLDEAIGRFWNYYVHAGHISDMQLFFHMASRRFEEPDRFDDFASTAVDGWVHFFTVAAEADGMEESAARTVSRLTLATLRGIIVDYLITGDLANGERSLDAYRAMVSSMTGAAVRGRSRTSRRAVSG